jgi:hypothetical protein
MHQSEEDDVEPVGFVLVTRRRKLVRIFFFSLLAELVEIKTFPNALLVK